MRPSEGGGQGFGRRQSSAARCAATHEGGEGAIDRGNEGKNKE